MRNNHLLFLLSAGLVLSLTGCEKEPEAKNGDPQEVRFSVATANPETKTAYTNDGTFDKGNLIWERIDWVKGDPLLIWSDYAVGRVDGDTNAAHYVVGDPITTHDEGAPYPNQSWAIIKDNADLGLIYDDDHKGTYKFWSIYPSGAAIDPTPTGGTATNANQVSYEIAGTANLDSAETTSGTKTVSVEGESVSIDTIALKPDMTKAVMLAAVEDAEYNGEVILKYYPAFTAFEYTMVAKGEDVDLTKVVIKSTSDLSGIVTAAVKAGQRNNGDGGNVIGASTYSVADGASKEITVNLPANTQITTTKQLTFTVFALPQDITGMTLEFYNGDLLIATGNLKKDGEDFTFAACKKHRIYGLAVPGGKWHLYLEADVLDWIDAEQSIEYGEADEGGVVISASALEHITGASSWSRTDATLSSATSPLKAYFSVYSPTNGKWRITLKGTNAGHFTISTDPEGTTGTNADGDAYIQGNVNGRVIFTLTPNGAASGETVELWFSVVDNDGKEHVLHSEVTRSSDPLTVRVP